MPVNRLFVSEKQKPLTGLDRFCPLVTGLTPSVSVTGVLLWRRRLADSASAIEKHTPVTWEHV